MKKIKKLPIAIMVGILFMLAISMIPITIANPEPETSTITGIPNIRSTEPPRHETVWMTGSYDSPTQFLPWSTNLPPGSELMYESLFGYNSEKGLLIPCIGTNYSWSETGDTITIDLNPLAKWSDGSAIQADDVAYSYVLASNQTRYRKDFTARFTDFVEVDTDTVQLKVNTTAGYNFSRQVEIWIKYNIPIVPKHVWSLIVADKGTTDFMGIGYQYDWFDSTDVPNAWKVISGPYAPVYRDASETTCAYQYRDSWWGNGTLYLDIPNADRDPPKYIGGTRFATNTEQDLAFQQGDIDLYAGYPHHIWEWWQGKTPSDPGYWIKGWYGHKAPYELAASTLVTLAPNHLRANTPFAERKFREALAFAINYDPIPDAAASGYWTKSKPGYIDNNSALHKPYYNPLITSMFQKYLNVSKAIELLNSIPGMSGSVATGWTYNTHAVGPYEAIVPIGWSDVIAYTEMVCKDISDNLGIDITVTQVDFETGYQPAIENNDYDFAMFCVGNRISDPPERFLDYMRGVHLWNKNATNWNNATFETYWQTLETANPTDYYTNLQILQYLLAREVPEVPGFVNGYWYAFSEYQWVGWASADNNFQQICTTWTNDQFAVKTRLILNLVNTGRKPSEEAIPWFGLEFFVMVGIISTIILAGLTLNRKRE